jgi:acyl carrier protein phosphodiesterase
LNYLAHIYLSGSDEELLFGNFIADGVKGRQINRFPQEIVRGILLHRMIDQFTDAHPLVQQSVRRLRERYHKYAGVVLDIYYDHFLASRFGHYSPVPLLPFTTGAYQVIMKREELLPERVKLFLPHMIAHNWLFRYADMEGIRRSFSGLSRRTSFESGMETAALELEENFSFYLAGFEAFFPDVIAFVAGQLASIASLQEPG